jgi:hypothetical protein
MTMIAGVLCIGLALPALAEPTAPTTSVESVRITSRYSGWSRKRPETLVLVRQGEGFVRDGQSVDPAPVRALLAALTAPPVTRPRLECALETGWLQEHATGALAAVESRSSPRWQAAQRELFLRLFAHPPSCEPDRGGMDCEPDPEFPGRSLCMPRYDPPGLKAWSDDYPEVEVSVATERGPLTISSTFQGPYMVPWRVRGEREPTFSYDLRIPRAIAALMPEGFLNRSRVAGEGLVDALIELTMETIAPEWERMEAQAAVGASIATLESRGFRVHGSRLDRSCSPDAAVDGWMARLSRPDWPRNLSIDAFLPRDARGQIDVEPLVRTADDLAHAVLELPWLASALRDPMLPRASIRFAGGRSLAPVLADQVDRELRAHGRGEAADAILAAGTSGWPVSTWVLLPDRRAVLWRFGGTTVLGHDPAGWPSWSHGPEPTCYQRPKWDDRFVRSGTLWVAGQQGAGLIFSAAGEPQLEAKAAR